MITLPVLLNFDSQAVVGEMTVDETKLPKLPNFHFALGYRFPANNGGYELVCISAVPDSKFVGLRKSIYDTY